MNATTIKLGEQVLYKLVERLSKKRLGQVCVQNYAKINNRNFGLTMDFLSTFALQIIEQVNLHILKKNATRLFTYYVYIVYIAKCWRYYFDLIVHIDCWRYTDSAILYHILYFRFYWHLKSLMVKGQTSRLKRQSHGFQY